MLGNRHRQMARTSFTVHLGKLLRGGSDVELGFVDRGLDLFDVHFCIETKTKYIVCECLGTANSTRAGSRTIKGLLAHGLHGLDRLDGHFAVGLPRRLAG